MEILARAAEQPVGSVPGLAIVIVVGVVVVVLTGMSRNIASGRTGSRHLTRAERVGREQMESALQDAVSRHLAELPPEPRVRPSIDLTARIDLTGDGTDADSDVDLATEGEPDAEVESATAPVDPEATD